MAMVGTRCGESVSRMQPAGSRQADTATIHVSTPGHEPLGPTWLPKWTAKNGNGAGWPDGHSYRVRRWATSRAASCGGVKSLHWYPKSRSVPSRAVEAALSPPIYQPDPGGKGR